jgi:hypothetical protein
MFDDDEDDHASAGNTMHLSRQRISTDLHMGGGVEPSVLPADTVVPLARSDDRLVVGAAVAADGVDDIRSVDARGAFDASRAEAAAFAAERRAELARLSPSAADKWAQVPHRSSLDRSDVSGASPGEHHKRRRLDQPLVSEGDEGNNDSTTLGHAAVVHNRVDARGAAISATTPATAITTAAHASATPAAAAQHTPAIDLLAWSRGEIVGLGGGGAELLTPAHAQSRAAQRQQQRHRPRARGVEILSDDGYGASSTSPDTPPLLARKSTPATTATATTTAVSIDYRAVGSTSAPSGDVTRPSAHQLVGRCHPPGVDGAAWVVVDADGVVSLLNVFRLVERSVYESLLSTFSVPTERLPCEQRVGVSRSLARHVASCLDLGPPDGRRRAVMDRSITANGFTVALVDVAKACHVGDAPAASVDALATDVDTSSDACGGNEDVGGGGLDLFVSAVPRAGVVLGYSVRDLPQLISNACAQRDAARANVSRGEGGGGGVDATLSDDGPYRPEAVKCHLQVICHALSLLCCSARARHCTQHDTQRLWSNTAWAIYFCLCACVSVTMLCCECLLLSTRSNKGTAVCLSCQFFLAVAVRRTCSDAHVTMCDASTSSRHRVLSL